MTEKSQGPASAHADGQNVWKESALRREFSVSEGIANLRRWVGPKWAADYDLNFFEWLNSHPEKLLLDWSCEAEHLGAVGCTELP